MRSILGNALEVFNWHSGWIIWNLFLAFIPLALSLWLFRWHGRSRTALWWVGLIVFIAFLPNAPYLLTDVIHLIRATRSGYSAWIITLIFVPLHLFAILAGFEAYVLSVMNQSSYLRRQGAERFVVSAELFTHALCAIGVYLGRFLRFNSWDLVVDPGNVVLLSFNELTKTFPLLVVGVTFLVITVLYWICKQITLGLVLRFREVRQQRSFE
jgi:uncharacterized membrane protein